MGSFKDQQVAIIRKQRPEQCWPFVNVCESSVKEPRGWERGRQAAISHWMGQHSSRALHLQERQGQNEVWLVKGNAGSCVNMHEKMLTGPQSGLLNREKYNGLFFSKNKTKQAVNKMWTEFGELKQAFFKWAVNFYLGKVKGLQSFLGRKFCFPKGKFKTGTGLVSRKKEGEARPQEKLMKNYLEYFSSCLISDVVPGT